MAKDGIEIDAGTQPLKKAELVQALVSRTQMKKPEARDAAEALLAILGEAIAEGRDVSLPNLGAIKIKRRIEGNGGPVFVARLRPKVAGDGKTGEE